MANLQRLVSDALPDIAAKYGEIDLKDRLVEFAVARLGQSEEEAAQAILPMLFESVSGFLVKHVALAAGSSSSSNNDQAINVPDVILDPEPNYGVEVEAAVLPDISNITTPYWVSLTRKKGYRRLHRAGGCHCVAECFEEVPDIACAVFNSRCGHCWRSGEKAKAVKISERAAEDSDSSVSTSSESSSTSDE